MPTSAVPRRWRSVALARRRSLRRCVPRTRRRSGSARALREEVEALARRARVELGREPAEGGGPAAALGLTDREVQVLALLAVGRTNRAIGEELFISAKTASAHVSRIFAKLGVANRAEAAGVAYRLGLVPDRSS
jgi:DNA-binding NarL/FixJ family response regulator